MSVRILPPERLQPCRTRGCKGKMRPSRYLAGWLWCRQCGVYRQEGR